MKRIYLIPILLFLSILMISCSNDDDNLSSSGEIVGTWEYFRAGGVFNGQEVLTAWERMCPGKRDQWEILESGIIKDYVYYEDCNLYLDEGTWTYSGNILYLSADNITREAEVLILTENTLKIKIEDPEMEVSEIIFEFKRV